MGVRKFWMVDFEFWVNFRQEDRICRMNRILNVRFWIMESSYALCGYGVIREGKFWILDFGW